MEPLVASTLLSGASSILGGVFGSSSARRERKAAEKREREKYIALRDNAAAGGFNPLTALLAGGASGGGSSWGGGTPLASTELILGGLRDLGQVFTGATSQEAARARLETDIAQIKLDSAAATLAKERTLLATAADRQAQGQFRTRAVRIGPGAKTGSPTVNSTVAGGSIVDPSRKVESMPITNSSGAIEISNAGTAGTVYLPGDAGEPWGADEMVTVATLGTPQVLNNHVKQINRGRGFFQTAFDDLIPTGLYRGFALNKAVKSGDVPRSPALNALKNLAAPSSPRRAQLWSNR